MSSAATSTPTIRGRNRLKSLDGLRGVAAVVVLVNHCLLVLPSLALAYKAPGSAGFSSPEWWMTVTPLAALWGGTEAVRIFFVLSGFVLVLPLISVKAPDWKRWYPSRLARLYVPTWAAALLALALFVLIPRTVNPEASWWINSHSREMAVEEFVGPFTLLFGETGWLLSPLWSLKWEVVFSLLLPFYFWAMVRTGSKPALQAASLIVLSLGGYTLGIDALKYMPFFGLGIVLAQNKNKIAEVVEGWTPKKWGCITVACLLALPAQHYRGLIPSNMANSLVMDAAQAMLFLPSALASVVLVAICGWSPRVKKLLESVPLQWLGSRSFSLYLVHETIVVSAANIFGPDRYGLSIGAVVVVSLLLAELFFRLVERPSHKLAVRINPKKTAPIGRALRTGS